MQSKSPAIFINDDEVEFKVIYVYSYKSKKMRKYTISEAERRIDLIGGGMVAIRSTHYADNLRGEGLDLAVLDEAA